MNDNSKPSTTPIALAHPIQASKAIASPLASLPPEWSIITAEFAAFWSDYLKGELGIATRVAEWIREEGMTLEDFQRAVKRLKRPEATSKITHFGQLLAGLGAEVDHVISERKRAATNAEVQRLCREGFPTAPPAPRRFVPIHEHRKPT